MVALAAIMAAIGLAVYFMHGLEKEKNRYKTGPATKNRWPEKRDDPGQRNTSEDLRSDETELREQITMDNDEVSQESDTLPV